MKIKVRLSNPLRDKTANNIVVAILVGISLTNFIQTLTYSVGMEGPPASWIWRNVIAFIASLVIAWLISLLARR